MPLNIDPKLLDALAQRNVTVQQQPQQSDAEKGGPSLLAKILYATGGGADAASTVYGLHTGLGHEANPAVNWAPKNLQVPLGAAMEVGGLTLLDKLLGKKHPKIMDAALIGLGALHGGLAVGNMKTIADAKRERNTPAAQPNAIPSNLVQGPDGSYYDPNYFGGK